MPEIGTWTTSSGTATAHLELDGDANAEELPPWASGALSGAVTGAVTGAAAGPYGALIGAAAGAGIGAASAYANAPAPTTGAGAPKTNAAPAPASPKAGAVDSRAKVIQALQQFAAVVPVMVQLLNSGQGAKEADFGGDLQVTEGFSESVNEAWGPESFEGSWTVP